MVGPISTEERASQLLRLKIGVSVLVGVSMCIVAFQGGASLPVMGVAGLVGTTLGAVLAWYIFPDADAYRDTDEQGTYSYREK